MIQNQDGLKYAYQNKHLLKNETSKINFLCSWTTQNSCSDNATIFKTEIFTRFCHDNGILHKFIVLGHHSTKGIVERYNQTLKQNLKLYKHKSAFLSNSTRNPLMLPFNTTS